jgi:hypothetical protein
MTTCHTIKSQTANHVVGCVRRALPAADCVVGTEFLVDRAFHFSAALGSIVILRSH